MTPQYLEKLLLITLEVVNNWLWATLSGYREDNVASRAMSGRFSCRAYGSLLSVEWLIPAPINCGVHLCGAHAQLMSRDEHVVQGTGKPALSLFL